MQLKVKADANEARFQLTIFSYPNENRIVEVCEVIYDSKDKNLIASLSTLPYIIGRSFPHQEVIKLNQIFRELGVGHRFQNLAVATETIGFDPDEQTKAADGAAKPKLLIKKSAPLLNFASMKMLGAAALIILIAGAGLWMWVNHSSTNTGTQIQPSENLSSIPVNAEAVIEQLRNDVEFRKEKKFLWSKAKLQTALEQKDGVRTFDNSQAVIRYREGSRVSVKANTLLIIGAKAEPEAKIIKLESGTLSARIPPSNEQHRLSIETPSGTLEVVSPKLGEKPQPETRVETKVNQGKVTVSVTQGSAVLKPSFKDGKPVQIQSLQQIIASSTAVSLPTAFIPEIDLKSPSENAVIFMDPQQGGSIRFEWESIDEKASYTLSISTDPQMNSILLSEKTTKPEFLVQYLDLGNLYWRVTSTFNEISYQSKIRQMNVQKYDH
jgi:hypothetical protein